MLIKSFSLLLFFTIASFEKFRFDNYTLYRITPENVQQIELLQNIQNSDPRYDFWTDPVASADFVSVMSSPQDRNDFENVLSQNEIKFSITMKNIQEAIDKERVNIYTRNSVSMQWNAYYTLDHIYAWLDDLAATYPDIVSIIIGGHSYEGREIKGIKISHQPGRRAVFIEGGIHSREWISPSATCYIINELLTSSYHETRAAANDFDWYVVPVTNPDGYVWTHEQSRMWRKNRRPFGTNVGVDLNRNWNNNWLVAGSSINPALDTYAGPGPFSEPETRSLSTFIASIGDKIDLYLSFHSFSELLLIPFGNSTQPYANYYDAMNIGRRAMGALSVRYGTQYVTGNIAEAIYQATGGSVDWVKEHLKVPLVYCYELRDKGQYGFLLPVEQILPNNLETMDSLLEMIHQAKRFGYMNHGYSIMNIGRRAMGALSVRYGTQYVTGNIAEAIYQATGGSVDWVKEHLKVPLVYCYELRDKGQYGFLLPVEQILPNNLETMDSLLEMIHQAKRFGYMNNGYSLVSSLLMVSFSVFYTLLRI